MSNKIARLLIFVVVDFAICLVTGLIVVIAEDVFGSQVVGIYASMLLIGLLAYWLIKWWKNRKR